MKKHVITAVAAVLMATPSYSDVINESICGASPGGLWSLVGAGLDASVKAGVPGSTITYQTSSGGLANVVQVNSGVCGLGIANDGDLAYATAGKDPFNEPVEGLSAVAVLYDWAPVWWIARSDFAAEYGLETLNDIAEKKPPIRLVMNRKGLLTSAITEATLNSLGVTIEDIESWGGSVQFQASKEQTSLMRDGRVDMLANTLFEGHSSLQQMSQAVDLTMLSTPPEAAKAVMDEYFLKPWTISAEANPGKNGDIATVTTSVILFVKEEMSSDVVYKITKSMIENPEKMGSVSKAMGRFTPNGMVDQSVVPFHPGALQAYKEAGLM